MKARILLLTLLVTAAFGRDSQKEDFQISGVVVDHLTKKPLNHVLVQITKDEKNGGEATALTESDGRFLFLHVPKGKYRLTAEKRGQMPEGFQNDGGYGTAIVVDGHQKTDEIVFALRTDAFINGTVMDESGEPVRGAQIILYREMVNDGEPQTFQIRNGTTNSSGQFHLGHLDGGSYYIAVTATPWYSRAGGAEDHNSTYPVTFYGDTSDGNAARVITLAEGGTVDLQVNLHAVPAIRVKLANQVRGVALFVAGPQGIRVSSPGSFVVTGGRNISGPGVQVINGLVSPAPQEVSMELVNLAAGHYEVVRYGENGGLVGTSQIMDLVDGGTLNFDDSAFASTISGSVTFDGARPSGNLQILLSRGHLGSVAAEIAPDGTFKFAEPLDGTMQVTLGSPALTITSITAKGAKVIGHGLQVSGGSPVQLLVHVAPSESLSKMEGFAVQNGVGVPGAMVLLVPKDLGDKQSFRRDQSDADGSFTLFSVLPGRYTLLAIDDGHDLAYKSEQVIAPYLAQGLQITIPLGAKNDLKVPLQPRKR